MSDAIREDDLAQQVVAAAEQGFPRDRSAQVRTVAQRHTALGLGVTLRALQIITARDVAERG